MGKKRLHDVSSYANEASDKIVEVATVVGESVAIVSIEIIDR